MSTSDTCKNCQAGVIRSILCRAIKLLVSGDTAQTLAASALHMGQQLMTLCCDCCSQEPTLGVKMAVVRVTTTGRCTRAHSGMLTCTHTHTPQVSLYSQQQQSDGCGIQLLLSSAGWLEFACISGCQAGALTPEEYDIRQSTSWSDADTCHPSKSNMRVHINPHPCMGIASTPAPS